MLGQRQFDIVLSLHTNRGTGSSSLAAPLSGTPTTLFYALRLEAGCWWVPLLRLGKECIGAPALPPSQFANALEDALKEIRTSSIETASCKGQFQFP
jgi:hypothetical protein